MSNKALVGLIVLIGLVGGVMVWGQNNPPAPEENIEITAEPTNFEKSGVITVNNPGQAQGVMSLVYEEPGKPALTKELKLDEVSICAASTGAIACMAMSVTFDAAFHGKHAVVEGIEQEDGSILLRKIRLFEEGQAYLPTSRGRTYIPWINARELILSCNVEMAMQAHDLNVYLTLKDGKKVVAVEPVIDEVFKVVNEAPARCGNIGLATE